ncbi:MAG: NAD-dependent epimerase/dehydratase family protein [Ilumatobacteraceae bacterium]
MSSALGLRVELSGGIVQHHLVLGAGPIGSGISRRLAEQGKPVTIATRSGNGPDHPLVSKVRLDATDSEQLTALAHGAAVIFNCVNPPYHRWGSDWPPLHQSIMTAAERTGAVVVMTDNLYCFGPSSSMPMREGDPMTATGVKGGMRRRMTEELLAAHAAGRLRATLARASDFYGPDVVYGGWERVIPRVLAGKKVSVLGRLDTPHSFTYVPDVVTTMVAIATDERAWGRPWHVPSAPAVSQGDVVQLFAAAAGTTVQMSSVPSLALTLGGLFNPTLKSVKEVLYQRDKPWVVDASLTEKTFGLAATPLAEGAAATVAWWTSRSKSA